MQSSNYCMGSLFHCDCRRYIPLSFFLVTILSRILINNYKKVVEGEGRDPEAIQLLPKNLMALTTIMNINCIHVNPVLEGQEVPNSYQNY